jgi:hypothetical protein
MDRDQVKAYSDKVFASMAGAMTAGMAYVGVKTGLFSAMAGAGPMSAAEIVEKTGLNARYVEEWLKGITTAGYLEHDPATDRYVLHEELAYLLASEGTDHFMGGLFLVAPILLRVAPQVAAAFRAAGGVPFEAYGSDMVEAIDLMSAGIYEQRFASQWLGKMPDVVKRLERAGCWLRIGPRGPGDRPRLPEMRGRRIGPGPGLDRAGTRRGCRCRAAPVRGGQHIHFRRRRRLRPDHCVRLHP